MNIKQALKRKNKLIGLIAEEFSKASKYNVIEEGNSRPYSATEAVTNWLKLSDELVELKTKIHLANAPMYGKIFLISELKSQIKFLRSLDCTSGKTSSRGWADEKTVVKHAELNILERDTMVKNMEARIEHLQDELDEWNHKTIIN